MGELEIRVGFRFGGFFIIIFRVFFIISSWVSIAVFIFVSYLMFLGELREY